MLKRTPIERPDRASSVARTSRALGDVTRLAIVELLAANGELCVCDVVEALDTAQPLLSHHLRVLREAGLVSDRRQGRWTYYALEPNAFVGYTGDIAALAKGEGTLGSAQRRPPTRRCD